ncbi:N-acetylgalactosaminyltransferase 6-like [Pectinophora gossypiella]|nr:N-acetylgalactosaminyltransferase 6-like [Pectinophora gossypiella]
MSLLKLLVVQLQRKILRLLRIRNLVLLLILGFFILNCIIIVGDVAAKAKTGNLKAFFSIKAEPFVPQNTQKIDWHDYAQIKYEKQRTGMGEQGKAAYLPNETIAYQKKIYSTNGFNGALSDKIALNRSLPDIRHRKCRKRRYIASLPTVSVVVPFHNEHLSALLRTAFSVLYRSPEHLITEIFLVNDGSTKQYPTLDDYLATNMPKVKQLRIQNRSGLINARLVGAKVATGDVLVILDAHSEANVNWLPPLLEPIAVNYKTVVCPFVDVIDYNTFEYRAQDEGARGAFDWEFYYKRLPLMPADERKMPEPFESPVMAGGYLAISRKFFWELGGYDPGIEIWGGEQYELSFKVWMCGGRLIDAPCSRVGHIYRGPGPALFPSPRPYDFVSKNYRRVAEVWMDEYAQYLYKRRPNWLKVDPGDISEQKALRQKLQCKSFRWYITKVAFDLVERYPPVEPKPFASGRIKVPAEDYCLDASDKKPKASLMLTSCRDGTGAADPDQDWMVSWHKDIRLKKRNVCWDVPNAEKFSPILLFPCHLGGGNQFWKYDSETRSFTHNSQSCLEWDIKKQRVYISPCIYGKMVQQWDVDDVDLERMKQWDEPPPVYGKE